MTEDGIRAHHTFYFTDTDKEMIFACDKYGNIVKRPAKPVHRGEREMVRVRFWNGLTVRASPNHRFITEDGREVEARKLFGQWVRFMGQNPLLDIYLKNDVDIDLHKDPSGIVTFGFLYGLGQRAGFVSRHQLPLWFYRTQLVDQLLFLRGLFTAMGEISEIPELESDRAEIQFNGDSSLVEEIQTVLATLGILSRQYELTRDDVAGKNCLVIERSSAYDFMLYIGFAREAKRKAFRWDELPSRKPTKLQVKAVERDNPSFGFNLAVDDADAFFANGVLVHNCNLCSINLAH